MELRLKKTTTIRDVKKQFSSLFPFLKLEFFIYHHNVKEGSALGREVNDELHLSDITGVLKEDTLTFEPSITVARLEQKLQNEYGLPVQIFRKSGKLWIETIETDNWSLQKQNEVGEASIRKTNFNINTLFL